MVWYGMVWYGMVWYVIPLWGGEILSPFGGDPPFGGKSLPPSGGEVLSFPSGEVEKKALPRGESLGSAPRVADLTLGKSSHRAWGAVESRCLRCTAAILPRSPACAEIALRGFLSHVGRV